MANEPINPKVHTGAASAGVGGGFAAILLIWLMQALGVPAEQFTPERIVALTGACAWAGAYIGGYLKSA